MLFVYLYIVTQITCLAVQLNICLYDAYWKFPLQIFQFLLEVMLLIFCILHDNIHCLSSCSLLCVYSKLGIFRWCTIETFVKDFSASIRGNGLYIWCIAFVWRLVPCPPPFQVPCFLFSCFILILHIYFWFH